MLHSICINGRLRFDLTRGNLRPIVLTFDPHSIQIARISIFLEGDIGLAMGLCRLRRYEFDEHRVRAVDTLDQ